MAAKRWHAEGVSPALLRSLTRSGQLVRMRQGVYATKRAVDWAFFFFLKKKKKKKKKKAESGPGA